MIIFLDDDVFHHFKFIFQSQIFQLPMLVWLYLVYVSRIIIIYFLVEIPLGAVDVLIKLLLKIRLIRIICFLVELIELLDLLRSLDEILPDDAGLVAVGLHLLQFETITAELRFFYLPVKLAWAEDVVPLLHRSASGSLHVRLHMLSIDDSSLSCRRLFLIAVDADHSRPLVDKHVIGFISAGFGVILAVVV